MNKNAINNLSSKYKGKNIVVFGLGKAGISSVDILLKAGANVYACDDNIASIKKCDEMFSSERTYNSGTEYNNIWEEVETLILSPGIPLTHPKPHKIVNIAHEKGCKIICDVELLYQASPDSKFIGITGTNGKSTTTALIGHILKLYSENNVEVGGNIGVPASSLKILGDGGVYVIEMSSYQLDLLDEMKFDISILLNITPDHIDRHGSMEGYIEAKKNIFRYQKNSEKKCGIALIAIDDEYCQEIADSFSGRFDAKLITISGFGNKNADIEVFENGDNIERLLRIGEKTYLLGGHKFLPGRHNMQNISAACSIVSVLNYDIDRLGEYIVSFTGLEHRLQFVKKVGNLTFINDSKATNAVAAKHALKGYKNSEDNKNIIWIAGGVAKDGGIKSLLGSLQNVKHVFLYGQAANEFAETLENIVEYTECDTLEDVINILKNNSDSYGNSIVLFSPACASFDQYKNFEERGKKFCELIECFQV